MKGHPKNVDVHVKDDSHIPVQEVYRAPDNGTGPNPDETHYSESLPTKMDELIAEENCCPNLTETAGSIFSWDSLSELEQMFQ